MGIDWLDQQRGAGFPVVTLDDALREQYPPQVLAAVASVYATEGSGAMVPSWSIRLALGPLIVTLSIRWCAPIRS